MFNRAVVAIIGVFSQLLLYSGLISSNASKEQVDWAKNGTAGPAVLNVTRLKIRQNVNGTVAGGGDYQHTNIYFMNVPMDKLAYVEPDVPSKWWNSTKEYPLSVSAWSSSSSLSFMLPLTVQGAAYHMARRFLCPTRNDSDDSDVYVAVSSASPDPVSYRLQVSTKEKGTFVIQTLDRKIEPFAVGPAWPDHWEFRFPAGVDAADVVVAAAADDKGWHQPATIIIQEAKCPMLVEESESSKAYRTVSFVHRATITLIKSRSYPSVFLSFLSSRNASKPTQKKKVQLRIIGSSSDGSYSGPVVTAVGVALLVLAAPVLCFVVLKMSGRHLVSELRAEEDHQDPAAQGQGRLIRDPEEEEQGSPVYPSAGVSSATGRAYWLDIVHYPRVVVAVVAVLSMVVLAVTLHMAPEYESRDRCYFNYECLRYAGPVSAFNHVFTYSFSYSLCALAMTCYLVLFNCALPGVVSKTHKPILVAVLMAVLAQGLVSGAFQACPTPFLHFTENSLLNLALLLMAASMYGPPSVNVVIALWVTMNVLSAIAASPGYHGSGLPSAMVLAALIPIVMTGWHVRNKALTENTPLRQVLSYPGTLVLIGWCLVQSACCGLLHHTLDAPSFLTCSTVIGTGSYFLYHVMRKRSIAAGFSVWMTMLCFALVAMVLWATGLAVYLTKRADVAVPPAYSRSKNGPCVLLHFYDWSDLWALCSSFALLWQFVSFLLYNCI